LKHLTERNFVGKPKQQSTYQAFQLLFVIAREGWLDVPNKADESIAFEQCLLVVLTSQLNINSFLLVELVIETYALLDNI